MPSVTPLTHHNTRRHDGGTFGTVAKHGIRTRISVRPHDLVPVGVQVRILPVPNGTRGGIVDTAERSAPSAAIPSRMHRGNKH